ncbi:MAG: hypothetical protein U1E52_12060 [Geminicoccaceae bacterium]
MGQETTASGSRIRRGGRAHDARDGRLCSASDLRVLVKLAPAALIAAAVPVRHWDRLCLALAGGGAAGDALRRRREALLLVEQLSMLRGHWSASWADSVRLAGLEHLEAALARGRGAILWVMPSTFSSLIAKRALSEAGVAVHHITRVAHGFSPTWVGQRVLNPLRSRVEADYLAERILLPLAGMPPAAMRRVVRLLADNRVVSLTLGRSGAQVVELVRREGTFRIATGGPNLALRHGAALLPVWAARTGAGQFVTTIEPPLPVSVGGDVRAALRDTAEVMLDRFVALVARWPDQATLADLAATA